MQNVEYRTETAECMIHSIRLHFLSARRSLIVILLFFISFTLYSASCFSGQAETGKPIVITSDKVEYFNKKKEGEFTGNVKAVQGKLTLTAEKLKVEFGEGGKEAKQILAIGNVNIYREGLIAASERAIFYNKEQKVILTDRPRVSSRNSRFTGKSITIYIEEDRFVIEVDVKGIIVFPGKREKIQPQGAIENG